MSFEKIRERYLKNYITDDQLERFKALGIITEDQYTEIYALKHPAEPGTADEASVSAAAAEG